MAAAPARRRVTAPLPTRRPAPRRPATRRSAPARQATGAFVLDKLLAGRAWIGLVFVLLAGIVFFNVDLLQMNREIARTADRAATVKAENARLRADLARLGSSERIQEVAAQAGLVLPAPGEVRYLRSTPATDARRAAKRIDRGKAAAAPEPIPPAADPAAPAADPADPLRPTPPRLRRRPPWRPRRPPRPSRRRPRPWPWSTAGSASSSPSSFCSSASPRCVPPGWGPCGRTR